MGQMYLCNDKVRDWGVQNVEDFRMLLEPYTIHSPDYSFTGGGGSGSSYIVYIYLAHIRQHIGVDKKTQF
jgi:hypothetical protein